MLSLIATLLAIVLPIVMFYGMLFRDIINFPLGDDFNAILAFVNGLSQCHSLGDKFLYFITAQHNEYKLFFEHAVVWLQYAVWGHINFSPLCALGNLLVLPIAVLLWKMFLPACSDKTMKLALFVPVPWLLFQLQYGETLDWAMAGLQNLPVVLFALAALYLLANGSRLTFLASIAMLVLAIASSGNGLLLIPVGITVLLLRKQFVRAVAWMGVALVCTAIYFFHYNFMSSATAPHRSVFATLVHLNPIYVLGFMGSAASIPFRCLSFVIGLLLCIFFVWMARRGFARRNPAVSYCVCFVLLTAVGVAGIRSELGVIESGAPRYTIYSALLIIFGWFAVAEEFLQHSRKALRNSKIYVSAVVISIIFSLFNDGVGVYQLQDRHDSLVRAMIAYDNPDAPGAGLAPDIVLRNETPEQREFAILARKILGESIKLGVYTVPSYNLAIPKRKP